MAQYKKEEVADFSNFMKRKETKTGPTRNPAIQEVTPVIRLTRRIKWMLGILVILIIAQTVLFIINRRETSPPLPEGTYLVFPPNEPARLESTKK